MRPVSFILALGIVGLPSLVSAQARLLPSAAPVSPAGAVQQVQSVTVQGKAQTTEVSFELPPGARFKESLNLKDRALELELRGAVVPATVQRAINAGGILAITASPRSDSGAVLSIRLADLGAYQLRTRSDGEVQVVIDGNGEEFPPRVVSLAPEPRSVTIASGPRARTGGGEELGERQVAADEHTEKVFAGWERTDDTPAMRGVHWNRTMLRDALATISKYSGRSVVPGVGTDTVVVSGDFHDAKWTDVLRSLARVNGLRIRITDGNIIMLEQVESVAKLEQSQPLETRVFRLSYIKASTAESKLKEHLSSRGKISAIEERGALMVTDVRDNVERVASILRVLDGADRQIRVSAMVVSIDKGVARDLGITYDVAKRNGLAVGGIPSPSTSGTATMDTGSLNIWRLVRDGVGFAGAIANPGPTSPAVKAILTTMAGDYSLAALVQALETNRVAKIVARQTGVVREGETFKGTSGERTPLRTTGYLGQNGVQTQVGQTAGQNPIGGGSGANGGAYPQTTVGIMETGTKLQVTPRIEPDDMVALDVTVERSTAVPSGIGDGGVQFLINEYGTKLRARNGATTVIGGLEDRVTGITESGVPFLSSLPVLGRLFKSTSRSSTERVLVIFVSAQVED